MTTNSCTILHVDMDAFYASIEQRDNPSLRGQPVVVGGGSGRGVVAAASYEARKFGIHSAMSGTAARRLCPELVFLPVRMDAYRAESMRIRAIFESFTPLVEPLSLDEAYLDTRGTERLFGSAEDVGRAVQRKIVEETGLGVSVGVGPNKWVAKLCSDLRKPNGFVVAPPDLPAFLAPLPVSRLWGVGEKGVERLHAVGLYTLGDLQRTPETSLVRALGPGGRELRDMALGKDDRVVTPHRQAKSMGSETTFSHDISETWVLSAWLMEQVEEVGESLRAKSLLAGGVEVKLRSGDFRTRSRSRKLAFASQTTTDLWDAARVLLEDLCCLELLPARLVGVTAIDLKRPEQVQRGLFDAVETQKPAKLDLALDAIRARFGTESVSRGTVWRRRHEEKEAQGEA
jgi:DNA polymerase-4